MTSLCFTPPGSGAPEALVAGHEDGSLRTWDVATGACLRSHRKKGPEFRHSDVVLGVVPSLQSQWVLGNYYFLFILYI